MCFTEASKNSIQVIKLFLETVDGTFKTFKFSFVVVNDSLSVVLSFLSSAGSSVSLLLCESGLLDSVLVVPFIVGKMVPVLLLFDSGPGFIGTLLILSPEVKILFLDHELSPHLVLVVVLIVEFFFIVEDSLSFFPCLFLQSQFFFLFKKESLFFSLFPFFHEFEVVVEESFDFFVVLV